MNDRTRSRGQILLVGAVALAFVVLGLTAVYTAQLSARPASAGTAGVDAGNAEEFTRETRRNVRVIGVRKNHQSPRLTSAAANASVANGTANYSELVAETYAGRSGTVAEVEYVGAEAYGTRTLTRSNNTTFVDSSASPNVADWRPVNSVSKVGWFVFSLNLTAMERGPGQPFRVTVNRTNGTGPDVQTTYEFTRNSSGSSVVTIDVTTTGPETANGTTCNPRGERSVVNLKRGVTFTGGCEFAPSLAEQRRHGPVRYVQFNNTGAAPGGKPRAAGAFSIVTNQTNASATNWGANGLVACSDPAAGPADPCNTHVVWNATVRTAFYTDRVSYTNEQNVTVYEGV